MAEPQENEAPEFLAITGELLTLVAADDLDGVEKLRDSIEADWWNVALTLSYLIRDAFSGKPEALAILAQTFEDARAWQDQGQ